MKKSKLTASPFILYLLVTLSPLGIDLHLPALVQIKQYFSVDNSTAQLSVLVFVLAMGIGNLIFGLLADTLGKRKIGALGIIIFILGATGVILFDDYQLLLCCRVLQGLGASSASVIAYATVNENYEGEMAATIFSIQSGCLNIIPAIAPLIGALLLLVATWQAIFVAFVIYGSIVMYYFLRNFNYADQQADVSYISAFSRLRKDYTFIFYGIVCTVLLGYIMTFLNLAPILMIEKMKVSTLFFAACFGINAIIIATVSFLLGHAIRHYGASRCVEIGLYFMGCSSVGLWSLSDSMTVPIFTIFIAIGSIGFAFSFGTSMSLALALALAKHQAYSGIASGFLGCLYLSFSPIIAYLTLQIDNNTTFSFGVVFTIAVILMLMVSTYKKPLTPKMTNASHP